MNDALTLDGGQGGDIASRIQALQQRQAAILTRIEKLERQCDNGHSNNTSGAMGSASMVSDVQRRLGEELVSKGIVNHRFVRAPSEYYDRPLEFRREILQAASVHHLCKTIIMENTRVEAGEDGIQKYWMVIVQYSARLHSDKLRHFVQAAHNGALGKSKINMRLCPEAISDELSGFEHNAVSPVGIKTQLPIILSHRIAQLAPDEFWLGAGEVDLKVGMSAAEFIKVYQPHVVDCTYDDAPANK